MASIDQVTNPVTSVASSEASPQIQGSALIYCYKYKKSDEKLDVDATLLNLLASKLSEGSSFVLVSCRIIARATESGQTLAAAFVSSSSSMTIDQVFGVQGAVGFTSNKYNFGSQESITMNVPDWYSKQIKPTSALVETPKFMMTASAGMVVTVEFVIKCNGPLRVFSPF
jgi:hypothetical protein